MKRRYWVFLFIIIFGLTGLFVTLRPEVNASVAAHAATQTIAGNSPEQIAFQATHPNITTKYGDCIRIARRSGGDCLR